MFSDRVGGLRTLRFRLMVWNACVVILTAVTTLVIVREGVRYSLLSEMDQVLAEDLSEIGFTFSEARRNSLMDIQTDLNRKARGHSHHGWFVQILNDDGQAVWSSENTPTESPADPPMNADLAPYSSGGSRLVRQTFHLPDTPRMTLRVGASLQFLDRDMQHIDRLTMMGAGIVLIVAPLSGYWLAGRATRPLADIIKTTARLRPAEMTERLPLRHTGDELDQLSQTINGLLDRIAEYLNQRRDFVANAAHELRTPLAAIRSSVEVALNSGRSQKEYEELLNVLISECTSLETLVNQLLLLAESDADRLKIHGEIINLSVVVEQSADMFRAVAETRNIELILRVAPNMHVEGNRHHLRQVLNNLIDNALKFTPDGGRILIRLGQFESSQRIILSVEDNGCGIAPEDLSHVFERFYRCDKSRQRDGNYHGTGLGLSICQAIVQAHGGDISAESSPRTGTVFSVTLNGSPPGEEPSHSPHRRTPASIER